MTRVRGCLLLLAFGGGLLLAGCDSFDPTEMFDIEGIFNTKKKLPGDRKAVFPEGTPGVPQGVPPELVRGAQQQPQSETTQSVPQQAAVQEPAGAEAKPEEKAKPKPKPKLAAKPKPAEPATGTATASAEHTAPSPRPEPPPAQKQQPQSEGAWPSKPQPPMAVQWPEPPTYSDRTRPQ